MPDKLADIVTPLQPHQQRVIDKLRASHGVLVAHGMGSGKTLTSIAASDALGLPTDVVAPAPLIPNYKKELDKHVSGNFPDVRMRSYDAAVRDGGSVNQNGLVVADEAHRMRNPGTAVHNLAQNIAKARARLLLSGTVAYNQPENLAPLLNAARGDDAVPVDAAKFRQQFVGERTVRPSFLQMIRGVKPGSIPELKNRQKLIDLATGYVDVHASGSTDFPERVEERVDVPMSSKQEEIYNFHEGKLPWYLRLKVQANLPMTKTESAQLNAFNSALRQTSNTPRSFVDGMNDDDELENAPKIQEAVRRLVQAQKSDPNFRGVVYSNYLDSGLNPYQRALQHEGLNSAVFHGGLSPTKRRTLVEDYNAGKLHALLVSSSGSEGLDLKGTKLMQLLEPHFNSAKTEQVIGRGIRYKSHAHLPENERNVHVERYFATHPKSLLNRIGLGKPSTAIDEYLYSRSKEKDVLGRQILDALQEASDAGPLKTAGFQTALALFTG